MYEWVPYPLTGLDRFLLLDLLEMSNGPRCIKRENKRPKDGAHRFLDLGCGITVFVPLFSGTRLDQRNRSCKRPQQVARRAAQCCPKRAGGWRGHVGA